VRSVGAILAGPNVVRIRASPPVAELLESLVRSFPAIEGEGADTSEWEIAESRAFPAVRGRFDVRKNGTPEVQGVELAIAVQELMWHLTHDAIANLGSGVGLHAGVVAGVDGRAVLLPAPSGSGKTTLTAALVAAGWDYLSDELGILDPSGVAVQPFARPLCLSRPAIPLLPGLTGRLPAELDVERCEKIQVRPDDIRDGAASRAAADVGAVVFPRYESGAATTVRALSRVETLVELLPNTFGLAAARQPALDTLAALCRVAPGYRLVSGDLQQAVSAVRDIMRGPTVQAEDLLGKQGSVAFER